MVEHGVDISGSPDRKQELELHRRKLEKARGDRTVARFKASVKGLRRVFEKHFPGQESQIEALIYNLAKVEAQLPNARHAIRSARYPGAGDRGPKRFALGLWENLSFIERHLKQAMDALEVLGGSENGHGDHDDDTSDD